MFYLKIQIPAKISYNFFLSRKKKKGGGFLQYFRKHVETRKAHCYTVNKYNVLTFSFLLSLDEYYSHLSIPTLSLQSLVQLYNLSKKVGLMFLLHPIILTPFPFWSRREKIGLCFE